MPDAVYIALCLLIPPLWGLLAARLFDILASKRKKTASTTTAAADDEWMYYI